MGFSFSTAGANTEERESLWQDTICEAFFPLDISFESTKPFHGSLSSWSLGEASLTKISCDGLVYRRHARHLLHEQDDVYLITVPCESEVQLRQDGREASCRRGQFVVQHGGMPYEFCQALPSQSWVLGIPSRVLRARIAVPERFACISFDATSGVGAMFVDMIGLIAGRMKETDSATRVMSGGHLIDILAMAISSDSGVSRSDMSSARIAHLYRAENFIRRNLAINLTPEIVADHCGISVRYLHSLFSGQGQSVSQWIKVQRLLMCKKLLGDPSRKETISEVAYEWGFSDQAHFSRLFRTEFGYTPSGYRKRNSKNSSQSLR